MLTEDSSTVLDAEFTLSKFSFSLVAVWFLGSLGENCLLCQTGAAKVCSSNETSSISDMKEMFLLGHFNT